MTRDEARALTYSTIMSSIGTPSGGAPTMEDFFDTKIGETLGEQGALEGWDTFLWEALAVKIQNAFQDQNYFIQDFGHSWLIENKDEEWESLIDFIGLKLKETA
ncbi:hypothetical protein [Nisaea sp.]|uniref:hypothetical protein n=1 Tax=Nisaea sp. TaxID=2024842 RepID=UPI0032EF81D6